MKWAALSLLFCLLILLGIAAYKADGSLSKGFIVSLKQGGKFLPVLFIAFLLMGYMEVLLPQEFVQKWLSDESGWKGIGLGWLAGILTPGGSLVGLPLVAALFRVGVGIGVLITYLTSLALLSLVRMPIEIGIYGWKLTLIRISASILLPPIAGGLAMLLYRR